MNLSNVDKTYKITTAEGLGDLQVWDIKQPPISVHGVFFEEDKYKRLPLSVAQTVSQGVCVLHSVPAGGRVKFRTNSRIVALYVTEAPYIYATQTACASSGFEIFANGKHVKSAFLQLENFKNLEQGKEFSAYVRFERKIMREIEIYFPLYSRVNQVLIGIELDAEIQESKNYKKMPPIFYYGSSISQGCCASKASCTYQSFIERWTDMDYINFGFAGNCRAEKTMLEYIAAQPMSVFVLEYDYNANTPEYLKETHLSCYQMIREKHLHIPIIMMSRPEANVSADSVVRRDIVKATYEYAIAKGDKNVYFIDGHTLFGKADKDVCTVEGCHPTDLGFYRMAKRIYKVLKTAFENIGETI